MCKAFRIYEELLDGKTVGYKIATPCEYGYTYSSADIYSAAFTARPIFYFIPDIHNLYRGQNACTDETHSMDSILVYEETEYEQDF